jgi:hypothetical protein
VPSGGAIPVRALVSDDAGGWYLGDDYQDQGDLSRRIAAALGLLPVRAVLTPGNGIDPASIQAPANVQVVKAAPQVLASAPNRDFVTA